MNIDNVRSLVRRRAWLVVLLMVVAGGVALLLSALEQKTYTATASLIFNNNQVNQQVAGLPTTFNNDPQAQQDTNVKLIGIGDVAARTAAKLGHGLNANGVRGATSASAVGDTDIVTVSAVATSPELATQIANTYSTIFVNEQGSSNQRYYTSALNVLERQLADMSPVQKASTNGLTLQSRAQSLSILAEIRSGSVQIGQLATQPTAPSTPKTKRNVALAVILGLLLGGLLVYVLEHLDRRLRDTDELERIYQLPLLGVVPQSSDLAQTRRSPETGALQVGPESESFSLIRAHLRYFNVDSELHTILVSSASPGDGKTTVAFRLAAAAAATGSRALLLEADLRRPTVHNHVPVDRGLGLSDVLIGAVPFSEAVQEVELEPSGGQSLRALDVLFAGTLPPNPSELMESSTMKSLLADVRDTYEFVVIDSPPITAVSDAFPLLLSVDGVIVVARLGQDRRFTERAHDIFQEVGAPMLGIVVNGSKARESDPYTYSYAAGVQQGSMKERNEARPPAVDAQQSLTRERDEHRPPAVDVS